LGVGARIGLWLGPFASPPQKECASTGCGGQGGSSGGAHIIKIPQARAPPTQWRHAPGSHAPAGAGRALRGGPLAHAPAGAGSAPTARPPPLVVLIKGNNYYARSLSQMINSLAVARSICGPSHELARKQHSNSNNNNNNKWPAAFCWSRPAATVSGKRRHSGHSRRRSHAKWTNDTEARRRPEIGSLHPCLSVALLASMN